MTDEPEVPPPWGTAPDSAGRADEGGVPPWGTAPEPGRPEPSAAVAVGRTGRPWAAWASLTAAALIVGAVVGGLSGGLDSSPGTPPPDGSSDVADGTTHLGDLRPGDCVDADFLAMGVTSVPVVPCGTAHNEEVVGTTVVHGATWPGAGAVGTAVRAACGSFLRHYVGARPGAHVPLVGWYPLAEASWSAGNRRIICVVDTATHTTGTLRGMAS